MQANKSKQLRPLPVHDQADEEEGDEGSEGSDDEGWEEMEVCCCAPVSVWFGVLSTGS